METKRKKKGMNALLYRTRVPKFGVERARRVAMSTMLDNEAMKSGMSTAGLVLIQISTELTLSSVRIKFSAL